MCELGIRNRSVQQTSALGATGKFTQGALQAAHGMAPRLRTRQKQDNASITVSALVILISIAQGGESQQLMQWPSMVTSVTSSWAQWSGSNPVTCIRCSGPNDLLGALENPKAWGLPTTNASSPVSTAGGVCGLQARDGWRPAPARLADFVEVEFDLPVNAYLIEVWEGADPSTLGTPAPQPGVAVPSLTLGRASAISKIEMKDPQGGYYAAIPTGGQSSTSSGAAAGAGVGAGTSALSAGCTLSRFQPPGGTTSFPTRAVRIYITPNGTGAAVVVQGVRLTGQVPTPSPAAAAGAPAPSAQPLPRPMSQPPLVPDNKVGAGAWQHLTPGSSNPGDGGGGGTTSTGDGGASSSRATASVIAPSVLVPGGLALIAAVAVAVFWVRRRWPGGTGGAGGDKAKPDPLLHQGLMSDGREPHGSISIALHQMAQGIHKRGMAAASSPGPSLISQGPGGSSDGGAGGRGSAQPISTRASQRRQNTVRPFYDADEPLLLFPSQELFLRAGGVVAPDTRPGTEYGLSGRGGSLGLGQEIQPADGRETDEMLPLPPAPPR